MKNKKNITLMSGVIFALLTGQNAMGQSMQYDCIIEPAKVLSLGSSVVGVLDDVLVERGDDVKKGQTVAFLESNVEKALLAIAKARSESLASLEASKVKLGFAERQLDRAKDLKTRDVISKQRFDELTVNYEVAIQELELAKDDVVRLKLEHDRAQATLEQRNIKSPINGIVRDVERGEGEYVFQDASILTVVQLNPLYVETFVPVDQFGKVEVGMMGKVTINQPEIMEKEAQVTVVDRIFDAASGTIGIRLELDNQNNQIPAGQRCKVSF